MSDVIRAFGMSMFHRGTCPKCGEPNDKGDHRKCSRRWPMQYGIGKGFAYRGDATETTIEEFKNITKLIAAGESDSTRIRFEIRIMAVPETQKPG